MKCCDGKLVFEEIGRGGDGCYSGLLERFFDDFNFQLIVDVVEVGGEEIEV